MMHFRAPLLVIQLVLISLTLQGGNAMLDREVLAMGTRLSVHLEGDSYNHLEQASEDLFAEVDRIEQACSTWRPDSQWSRLNTAKGQPVRLDPEWIALLDRIQTWNRKTDGAFDPVLMALMQTWGIRNGGRQPSIQEISSARRASGSSLLRLDSVNSTAQLRDPDAGIEEGGFLKGYALEAAKAKALKAGVASGVINFGGQLLAWGHPQVAFIASSEHRERPALRIHLKNASLSSSSCSERGRHILDPRLGEPCPDWGAVSVVAPDALSADVLSTALYVLGPEAGLLWARQHHVAAIFLVHGGTIRTSPRFASFHPKYLASPRPPSTNPKAISNSSKSR